MSDHPPRCFSERAATTVHTISRSAQLLFLVSRNCFPAASVPFEETLDAAEADESEPRTPQPVPEPRRSSWLGRRAASRSHLQQPHDAHAMSIRLQSCSWYCLAGSTRALFAQRSAGPLDRIRRKRGSLFTGNSHKQSSLPFELDRQRSRSNGDGAFLPTNFERHSWLYPGFAANILWDD